MPQRHLRSISKVSLRNSFHIRQKLVQTQVARISTTLNLPNRALICAHLTLGSWPQRLTIQVRVHFSQRLACRTISTMVKTVRCCHGIISTAFSHSAILRWCQAILKTMWLNSRTPTFVRFLTVRCSLAVS